MAVRRHIQAFEGEVETLAGVDLDSMWARLLNEFLNEFARIERQGLSALDMDRELTAFMEGLSEKPVDDLARKSSSVAYNQGRNAEILTAREDGRAQFVIRSEILDDRTCAACAQLDGSIFEIGQPGYLEFMPPAKCLGGDRCRGFYVAVSGN